MGILHRLDAVGRSLPRMPVVADRISANHPEVPDPGCLPDGVDGAPRHAPAILLPGLSPDLAQAPADGIQAGGSRLAAEYEVLTRQWTNGDGIRRHTRFV